MYENSFIMNLPTHAFVFNAWVVMIEQDNLKFTKGFHLNPLGGLVSYNESFKTQDATILAFISPWKFGFSKLCIPT